MLDVDGLGQVGGDHDEAVIGDVVRPLDYLGDGPASAAHVARLLEQLNGQVLLLAGSLIRHLHVLRLHRKVLDRQATVLERVGGAIYTQRQTVVHTVAEFHQAVGNPVAQAVLVQDRHGDVYVLLELDEAFSLVGNRAVADSLELYAESFLERIGEPHEVVAVHRHVVWVALVADHLLAITRYVSVLCGGPPALDGLAHDYHGPVVFMVPLFHRLERGDNLVVVVAVVKSHYVPAVCRPLVFDPVCVIDGLDDASHQFIVNAGVVVREQYA